MKKHFFTLLLSFAVFQTAYTQTALATLDFNETSIGILNGGDFF